MRSALILVSVFLALGLQVKNGIYSKKGKASYYAEKFHGNKTASGEPFNMHDYTAAHRTLPFNTFLLVIHVKTGRRVLVRINDRGPFIKGRILDLSQAAARRIGGFKHGVFSVIAQEVLFKPLDSTTVNLYASQPAMDCLGNIDSVSGWALRVWASSQLIHALYVANDLYVNENIENVLLCGLGEGDEREYAVVVNALPDRESSLELKRRLEELGFYGIRPFTSD